MWVLRKSELTEQKEDNSDNLIFLYSFRKITLVRIICINNIQIGFLLPLPTDSRIEKLHRTILIIP